MAPFCQTFACCIIVFVSSVSLYGKDSLLNGDFVYDDGGSVTGNPIVSGSSPLSELWELDYWGTPLSDSSSHKSWRPVTTLTFYWNKHYWGPSSYSFHLTNVLLHACTSCLIVPTLLVAIPGCFLWFATLTGLLFSSHPAHVEPVQNINGRADIISSLFYLIGFLFYAMIVLNIKCPHHRPAIKDIMISIFSIIPVFIFTVMGVLSKETAITLPLLCIVWDSAVISRLTFLRVSQKVSQVDRPQPSMICWILRSMLLLMCTTMISVYRHHKNENITPTLTLNANRISLQLCSDDCFIQMKLWKGLSIVWIWFEYVKTMCLPFTFSADWSGRHIPPLFELSNVTDIYELSYQDRNKKNEHNYDSVSSDILLFDQNYIRNDHISYGKGYQDIRLPILFSFILLLVAFLFEALKQSMLISVIEEDDDNEDELQQTNQSFKKKVTKEDKVRKFELLVSFLFLCFPFLLSSNIAVTVGTTKGERLIYLPLLGYCILLSYLLSPSPPSSSSSSSPSPPSSHSQNSVLTWAKKAVGLLLVAGYSHRTQMRANDWTSGFALWESGYVVGSELGYVSAHTLQNYGLALQWRGDFEAANSVFEEYDRLGNEDLDDMKHSVEIAHAQGMRLIGKLKEAKSKMELALQRVNAEIRRRESQGKSDHPSQKKRKGRIIRLIALCVSHESMVAAAELMQRAGSSSDAYALRCSEEFNHAFVELEKLNRYLSDHFSVAKRDHLTAMPYPFKGYEDLPGNSLFLSGSIPSLTRQYSSIIQKGQGGYLLTGGGGAGALLGYMGVQQKNPSESSAL